MSSKKSKKKERNQDNESLNTIKKYYNFVNKYKVYKQKHTYTSFGPSGKCGTYNIPDDKHKKFMKLYSKTMKYEELHMIERPRNVSPLIFDLDWKFSNKYKERQYTEETIKYTITTLTKILKHYYKLTEDNILAFVMEKPKPTHVVKKDQYKDGIHIIYPYLGVSTDMRYLIRDELYDKIKEDNGYGEIHSINDLDDIIDKCIISSNGITMYGSQKYGGQLYDLTHIYNHKGKDMKIDDIVHNKKDLPAILSNRKYNDDGEVDFKKKLNRKKLDRKLEVIRKKYKKGTKKKVKHKIIKKKYNDSDSDDDDDNPDKIRRMYKATEKDKMLAHKLVKLLSKKRATDFESWIRVGWALHNTDNSNKSMKKWIKFSKKCSGKFDENHCVNVWNRADDSGFTIASLHMWAKEDDPSGYSKLMKKSISNLYTYAESGTHNDVAKLIFELYKHEYKCVKLTKPQQWYEFQEHRWVGIGNGFTLRNKMSDVLTIDFAFLASAYYVESADKDKEGIARDTCLTKGKNVVKIIDKLKTVSYKSQLMCECADLFYDQEFEGMLDSNRNLIGFENGVYDLTQKWQDPKTGKERVGCFRPGTPDDCITLSTGYNYKEYSKDHKFIAKINEYFSQVQLQTDMQEYIKTLLASYLDGHITEQKFIIWTGNGSNAKSLSIDFFRMAFGEYCGVLPITALTQKQKGAESATPALALLRGKRFVVLQEPENDDKLNVGRMKELTGGDIILARQLYKEAYEFEPQFKLILVCNRLPFIPSTDGGTWRRIRVAPWQSKFIDLDENGLYYGQKLKKNQFPKDKGLKNKLKKWKRAFMWLLLTKYYPLYKNNSIKEPKIVLEHTERYKKESDIFHEYINESLTKTGKEKDYVPINLVYSSFRGWYKEAYMGKALPSRKDFILYLENHDIIIKSGKIMEMKLKDDDDTDAQIDELKNMD